MIIKRVNNNRRWRTMDISCKSIGQIRTPYQAIDQCPRNVEDDGPSCKIILDNDLTDGLFGLAAGDRILVLYWLGKSDFSKLRRLSRKTSELKGIFALRTPQRPNPIGAAIVSITEIHKNEITVKGLDCLDKTPLLDIKPAMSREQAL